MTMIVFEPRKEELLEMGFKKATYPYTFMTLDIDEWKIIYFDDKDNKFKLWIYDSDNGIIEQIFPESIEDIKTLIRLFKLK